MKFYRKHMSKQLEHDLQQFKRFNKSNYAGQIDDVNNKTPIPIVIPILVLLAAAALYLPAAIA